MDDEYHLDLYEKDPENTIKKMANNNGHPAGGKTKHKERVVDRENVTHCVQCKTMVKCGSLDYRLQPESFSIAGTKPDFGPLVTIVKSTGSDWLKYYLVIQLAQEGTEGGWSHFFDFNPEGFGLDISSIDLTKSFFELSVQNSHVDFKVHYNQQTILHINRSVDRVVGIT